MSGFLARLQEKRRTMVLAQASKSSATLAEKAEFSKKLEKEYKRQAKSRSQIGRVEKLKRQEFERKIAPVKKVLASLREKSEKRGDLFGVSGKRRGKRGLWDL